MPRGDKSKYTEKQKRQAEHIEEGYENRGVPENEAERRAWATVRWKATSRCGKEDAILTAADQASRLIETKRASNSDAPFHFL